MFFSLQNNLSNTLILKKNAKELFFNLKIIFKNKFEKIKSNRTELFKKKFVFNWNRSFDESYEQSIVEIYLFQVVKKTKNLVLDVHEK